MDYHRTSLDEVLPEGHSFPGRPAMDPRHRMQTLRMQLQPASGPRRMSRRRWTQRPSTQPAPGSSRPSIRSSTARPKRQGWRSPCSSPRAICSWKTSRGWARRCWPRPWPGASTVPSAGSSSPRTCSRPTSRACPSTTRRPGPSSSGTARCSPISSSATRSTAPRPRRNQPCWSAWKSTRSRWTARPTGWMSRSWWWLPRTPLRWRAPTRSRKRSATVSWPGFPWVTRTRSPRWRCSKPTRPRLRWPA